MKTKSVETHIREYQIDYVLGENWMPYATTQFLLYAENIAELLKSQGKTARIAEIHEGWRGLEIIK